MILINSKETNPYFNIAMEEYLLKNSNDDCFILWRNEPAVILGINQNAFSEINLDYIKDNNIPVVRRLTGGGAVFHDLGNVNFTFISSKNRDDFNNFIKFTTPIISYLNTIGVKAEFSGRNDLVIEGRKFSGNAQCSFNHKVMHHGTLLFSSEITNLSNALKPSSLKLESHGVKSVKSRVTNISEHLKSPMTVESFKDDLFRFAVDEFPNSKVYDFNSRDISSIDELAKEKYSTWDWNFGKSPQYQLKNSINYSGGNVEFYFNVKKGIITQIKIYGDFFGVKPTTDLESLLTNTQFNKEALRKKLQSINLKDYLTGITVDEFINGIAIN